ncbi:PREDICTED: ATP synthase subunit a-like, partial [Eufriesea mexicana]|uniref:ATP synthase subunit a-like n=1 Tax=Eufriesea mexicana TaxID=516756 RepID=UPI00083C66B2
IELIRNLIRPITLSIRLCANLISGHLILIILEIFITFIQAYVFSILIILYY